MSFYTLSHEVIISKAKLLDLLLGQGDLQIRLPNQKQITINEFSDRHDLREENGVTIHEAKIKGVSEETNVSYVDGSVIITPALNGKIFKCKFELQLQYTW